MAEEGQNVFDFGGMWDALHDVHAGGEQGDQEAPALNFRVLSWNINGPRHAARRNVLVPQVVTELNPDVLLLQESINVPTRETARRIGYDWVGANDVEQARVLYKPNVFRLLRKLDFNKILKKLFDEHEPQRALRGEQRVYKYRAIAARMRHIASQRDIIFVSFHNKRHGVGGEGVVVDMATTFCNVVEKLADINHENVPVVAGADLNCANFLHGGVNVSAYMYVPTPRRAGTAIVDYFVSSVNVDGTLAVNNFSNYLPDHPNHVFNHPVDMDLLGGQNNDTYQESVPHDPLMCNFSIQ